MGVVFILKLGLFKHVVLQIIREFVEDEISKMSVGYHGNQFLARSKNDDIQTAGKYIMKKLFVQQRWRR